MLKFRYLLVLAALISGMCQAKPLQLIVGYYDFPPSIYTTEEGRAAGPLVDLMTRMFNRGGYVPEFREMPIARLYNELREGRVDVWAGAIDQAELEGHVLESRRMLAEVKLNLYYRADTPAPTLPGDLSGKVLIRLSGYSYWPYTRALLLAPSRNIKHLSTSNRNSALALLNRRRGDYLLDYQLPIEQTLKAEGLAPLPFITVESLPIHLIVSSKRADAAQVLQTLDAVFDQMQANGEDMSLP